MNWYKISQNNSYGEFVVDENVSVDIFIEAPNADEANKKLLSLGAYFDGCSIGMDCPCCGDRWCPVSDRHYLPPDKTLREVIWACENAEKGVVWSYPWQQEKVNLFNCFELEGDYGKAIQKQATFSKRIEQAAEAWRNTLIGTTP